MKINVLIPLFVLIIIVTNNTYTCVWSKLNNTNIFENIFKNIKNKIIDVDQKFGIYPVDIKANQIFPNDTLKNSIINKNHPMEYFIPVLEYNLLGFDIFATDIKVKAESKKIYEDNTNKSRIDFPIMQAKNVNVNNEIFDLNFENIDLSSTYTIYDSELDKFSVHIPAYVAARYLPK